MSSTRTINLDQGGKLTAASVQAQLLIDFVTDDLGQEWLEIPHDVRQRLVRDSPKLTLIFRDLADLLRRST